MSLTTTTGARSKEQIVEERIRAWQLEQGELTMPRLFNIDEHAVSNGDETTEKAQSPEK